MQSECKHKENYRKVKLSAVQNCPKCMDVIHNFNRSAMTRINMSTATKTAYKEGVIQLINTFYHLFFHFGEMKFEFIEYFWRLV